MTGPSAAAGLIAAAGLPTYGLFGRGRDTYKYHVVLSKSGLCRDDVYPYCTEIELIGRYGIDCTYNSDFVIRKLEQYKYSCQCFP